MRLRFLFIGISTVMVLLLACKKDSVPETALFYGKWKTSYGDTVQFAREFGKDILTFNESMNPQMPMTTKREYRYTWDKLSIKMPDGYPAISVFRTFESFAWTEKGKSFTMLGNEWFLFMSSMTVFTFTKIP